MKESLHRKLAMGETRRPEYAGIWLNPKSRTVEAEGTSTAEKLGDAEYLLLWMLVRAQGAHVTAEELYDFAREQGVLSEQKDQKIKENRISVYICKLRNILSHLTNGKVIIPPGTPGRGYVLTTTEVPTAATKAYASEGYERSELLTKLLAKLEPGEGRRPEWGPMWLNLSERTLNAAGRSESLKLEPQEYQILWLLVRAQGTPIPTEEVHAFLYQDLPIEVEEPLIGNGIVVVINALRKKLKHLFGDMVHIRNRPGVGYYLEL